MARVIGRLTALTVERVKEPGMYPDGGGLFLQVTSTAAKSWVLRYSLNGKARAMGLGSLQTTSLADARAKALTAKEMRDRGVDPIVSRHEVRAQAQIDAARAKSIRICAEGYIKAHEPTWKNAKHRQQWGNTLETYAYPKLGSLPVLGGAFRLSGTAAT